MKTVLVRDDFTFSVHSTGFIVYYKGVPVWSANSPLDNGMHQRVAGKQARRQRRVFGDHAEKRILECISGHGPDTMMQAVREVDKGVRNA